MKECTPVVPALIPECGRVVGLPGAVDDDGSFAASTKNGSDGCSEHLFRQLQIDMDATLQRHVGALRRNLEQDLNEHVQAVEAVGQHCPLQSDSQSKLPPPGSSSLIA